MTWDMSFWDLVLSVAVSVLALALVPGVIENFKQHKGWSLRSGVLTTVFMFVVMVALWQLGAVISSIATFVEALLWMIITGQSYVWSPKPPCICVHGKEYCACGTKLATMPVTEGYGKESNRFYDNEQTPLCVVTDTKNHLIGATPSMDEAREMAERNTRRRKVVTSIAREFEWSRPK